MKFDLEKSIKSWRTQLRKHRGFEDADIEELEDHLRSKIELKISSGKTPEEAFQTALSEDFQDLSTISDIYMAERETSAFFSGLLTNYLKVGFRSFGRAKTYFFINLIGLVIGLSSVLYITTYLHNELTYDQFHENHRSIFRVNTLFDRANGKLYYPIIAPAFGPTLKANFTEIENMARMRYAYYVLMKHNNNSFYEEKVLFAESALLDMFSFKWLKGNRENALAEVNTVVLTESMATKYFGDTNPVGKVMTYNNEIDVKVIGVIEDVPKHSHITFDFLISFDTFKPGPGALEPLTSWKWLGFLTYIQLKGGIDKDNMEKRARDLFLASNSAHNNMKVEIELQALKDIYLTSGHLSNPQGGLFRVNDKKNLASLGIITILIIVISFFNYFNITSALMRTRSKEIGIRKVFGSSKMKTVTQMGTETVLIVLLSTVLAWLVLTFFVQSGLLTITGDGLLITAAISLGIILLFTIVSALLFGSTFTSFSTMSLLKSKLVSASSRKLSLGRLVLLLQFGISASLIMISLVVISQLKYFSKKDLGYEKSGILVSKFRSEEMHNRRQIFVDKLMKLPSVGAVSFGPSMDGSYSSSPLRLREWPVEQVIQTAYFGVDYQFKDIIGLEMVKGRIFSEAIARDSTEAIVVNEKLAAMLGLEDVLGARVRFTNAEYEIIGVFKDFHYQSLHHQIGPMALTMWLGQPRNVLIKYETQNIASTLQDIENSWREVFSDGGFPFDYRFLDEQLQSMYSKEQEFSFLLKTFTSLAILLAVLGLFGLSSINIQQKIKQIGIRRVLGAELHQIASVVGKKYLLTAIIGIIVALPFAYFLMSRWLENYVYSIDLGLKFPLITLLTVFGVTVVTLGFQVFRVMTVNPSTILRDE